MTNTELLQRVRFLIQQLSESKGKSWQLHNPNDPSERNPEVLLNTLCDRFEGLFIGIDITGKDSDKPINIIGFINKETGDVEFTSKDNIVVPIYNRDILSNMPEPDESDLYKKDKNNPDDRYNY